MPRKAPEKVIEHRISLSNFERDLLTRTIQQDRENRLYVAGVNQIGQIAGSSVLLYGLMAYFGYNLLGEAKNVITDFIDNSSSGLADVVGGWAGIPFATDEANAIRNANDRIDEAIVYEREQLRLNDVAGQALIMQLKDGEIDYATFREEMYAITDRNDQLEQLTKDIAFAKAQVRVVQARIVTPVPAWLAIEDWRSLLIASYDNAYNPSGELKERPEITY
jgi:hypothetical protein